MPVATGSIAFIGATRFQGKWDAIGNDGTGSQLPGAPNSNFSTLLADGGYHSSTLLTASQGDYWQVWRSDPISANNALIDGNQNWNNNDWAIYSGSAWYKLSHEDALASIIIGDLSSSSIHMGAAHDKHIIFDSGSSHSGSKNFKYDYYTDNVVLTGSLLVADDKKIIFGADNDASFEYDEDGTNTLLYAGASLRISDDTKLEFGTGGDASLEYDEDGTDTLLYAGASLRISDDTKLEFGSGGDATIEYDEDGTNELRFAGAAVTFEQGVTFDGDVALGADHDDLTAFHGRVTSHVIPRADNTYDLGSSSLQWKDIYVNGIGYIDQLGTDGDAVTAYISGGEIDNTVIGGETPALATFTTVIANTSIVPDESGGADLGTTSLEWGNIYIADDKKIFLGTDSDATIEYDEDGTNQLRFAGAQAIFEQSVVFNDDVVIADDKKIYFGPSNDATIEYDEDGTDELRFGGTKPVTFERDVSFDSNVTLGDANADVTTVTSQLTASEGVLIADDKKIYFGAGKDASIEYNENGNNKLVISGSAIGIEITGAITQTKGTVTLGTDLNVGDDLSLTSDSAVFNMGAGNDFTITHDGTTGATLAGNPVNITAGGASTWKTTAGAVLIDAEASTVTVDGHTGVTVQSTNSGDITLDSVADIILDADGANILFKDGGTLIGAINNNSNVLELSASVGGGNGDLKLISGMAGDITLDAANDIILSADGGNVTMDDGTLTIFDFDVDGTTMTIHDDQDTGDKFTITVAQHGATTISTTDDDAAAADITFTPDGSLVVSDDIKLCFGTGKDASIKYDEASTDKLIISGAAGGFDIDLPDNLLNAFIVGEEASPYLTVSTRNAEELVKFSVDARIIDDKKFYCGSGNSDAYIKYNEAGDDFLVISGSSAGIALSGSTIAMDGQLLVGPGVATTHNIHVRSATDASIYLEADTNNTPESDNVFIKMTQDGNLVRSIFGLTGADDTDPEGTAYTDILNNSIFLGSPTTGVGIQLGTNDAVRATVVPGGNVGIATTAPEHTLSVTGTFGVSGNVTLGNANASVSTVTSQLTASEGVLIADDKKIYFGAGKDASIEYNENGDDKLIISGAAGGFNIDLPDNVANAFTIGEEANPYMSVVTSNSAEAIMFSKDTWIIDDTKLYFGTGKDASIEYDEDGNDLLTFAGADVSFAGLVNVGTGIEITANEADTITATGGGAVTAGAVTQSARKGVITIDLATNSCNIANMASYTVTLTNAACDVDSVIAVTTTGVVMVNSHTLNDGGCKFVVTNSTGGAITSNFTINYVIL